MKLTRNNALIVLMLLMSVVWCYDVYVQHINSDFWLEISAENDASFEAQDSDVEISEEDQIFHIPTVLSALKADSIDNHLYISPELILPFYSVWYPPKLI